MTSPQVMPSDFLMKVVAEAVVAGYLRGHNNGMQGMALPPGEVEINSLVLEVCARMIVEFGIRVER